MLSVDSNSFDLGYIQALDDLLKCVRAQGLINSPEVQYIAWDLVKDLKKTNGK